MVPIARLMRLDRPIGYLLLLWPNLWALWIAASGRPSFKILFIFISGVFIMRSAGCVINDLADRHIDKHVKRTKQRPLATGELSVKTALSVFIILCSVAFILVLFLNLKTILIAFAGLVLSSLYPLMKRYTHLPQVILGIAWYVGILMAFTAIQNHLPPVAFLIYLIAIIWTVIYDTMYAMIDRDDDLKIGVKSTAILFAEYDKLCIGILQILMLSLLIILGITLQYKINFYHYYLSIFTVAVLFIYQQYLIKDRQPAQCLRAFLNNNWVGLVIFLGIILK